MSNRTLGLLPCKLISEFSKPYQWWREYPTPSAEAVFASDWIQDFWDDAIRLSLLDWLRKRLILGPPRPRSDRELAEMDEDYLTLEEFKRHYVTWMKTWPDPHDHSWCSGPHRTTLPEWVKREYIASHSA